ncbi:MAG: VPS10 domain-containing protein [Candidatus Eiseniibacteriota bacterium]
MSVTSRRSVAGAIGAVAAIVAGILATLPAPSVPVPPRAAGPKTPNEWFLLQRAWPHEDVRQSSRLAAWEEAQVLRAEAALLRAAPWTFAGPTNVGGRIADVECHPTDPNVCWIGAAEGGVMKTTDSGATWIPTMDFESSLSIGDIAVDPTDPQILYVGTGEPNGGGGSVTYGGTGVFKSTDGGATWANVGLSESRYIGRVVVDPSDPSRVFVAALGSLFSTSPDRGVYRSTDAGSTWSRVLSVNDSTGAVDVIVHPVDPDVVYAATWERTRAPDGYVYGGDGSGIWRSTDGGDSWAELVTGLPSGPTVGRIGIALAASNPSILYAIYAEASPGAFVGLYKTTNGGDTWTRTVDGALGGVYATYGWWFGNVRVDPVNANRVFAVGYDFFRSTDGGNSWVDVGSSMHVDHHGLDFAADGVLWEGNDGGMYRSTNGGTSWTKLPALPATQFYAVEVDEQNPSRRYGGTQDNGTNRTLTGALNDWTQILGGDGFTCLVDLTNNLYVYAEWQYGNLYRSTNGGSSFVSAQSGLTGRRNWCMPVVFDPVNPATLYTGTDRVFRSTNRAVSWTSVSPDLTNGPGSGNATFGTITALAVAPGNVNVIWAGTDDANLWVTQNGGTNWTEVGSALPQRWVTRVTVDPSAANVSYATISGFRWDEPLPHVFRSTDFGASWADISSDLPEAPVNDVVVDPANPSRLWVATDFGVFESANLGTSWSALGSGLPNVVVNDLRLHHPTRTLVAGTYGRSLWTFDVSAPTAAPEGESLADAGVVRLDGVAPNPLAAGDARVRFALSRDAPVSLRIFDVSGRVVVTLVDGARPAGEHIETWDGRDAGGTRVAAGVYFVRLEAAGIVRTRKVAVLD